MVTDMLAYCKLLDNSDQIDCPVDMVSLAEVLAIYVDVYMYSLSDL